MVEGGHNRNELLLPASIKILTIFDLSQGLRVGIGEKFGDIEISISKIDVWLNKNAPTRFIFSNIETEIFDFWVKKNV